MEVTAVPSSFEQVMLPHLDAAYNLARWLLRHDHDAEDAVQEAFLNAYRNFDRFRGGNGRAWLLTIVRNACFSHLRSGRRAGRVEPFEEELHGADLSPGEANAAAWQEANGELLREALAQLAPEFREVIVLHELEGLAYREIADVTGVPIGTIMSRLSRARQKLEAAVRGRSAKEANHGL